MSVKMIEREYNPPVSFHIAYYFYKNKSIYPYTHTVTKRHQLSLQQQTGLFEIIAMMFHSLFQLVNINLNECYDTMENEEK
jgi:hypothetical protein